MASQGNKAKSSPSFSSRLVVAISIGKSARSCWIMNIVLIYCSWCTDTHSHTVTSGVGTGEENEVSKLSEMAAARGSYAPDPIHTFSLLWLDFGADSWSNEEISNAQKSSKRKRQQGWNSPRSETRLSNRFNYSFWNLSYITTPFLYNYNWIVTLSL